MNNSVCRKNNDWKGTGFFTKIPYKYQLLPVLITNNHLIRKNEIILLYINNDNK